MRVSNTRHVRVADSESRIAGRNLNLNRVDSVSTSNRKDRSIDRRNASRYLGKVTRRDSQNCEEIVSNCIVDEYCLSIFRTFSRTDGVNLINPDFLYDA